jgi:hypothetical protein
MTRSGIRGWVEGMLEVDGVHADCLHLAVSGLSSTRPDGR